MRWLLDTNICSFVLKNRPAIMAHRLAHHLHEQIGISTVTIFELRTGCEKSQSREKMLARLAEFLRPFQIIPFDQQDAIHAAVIRAALEKAGTSIGPYDRLIAAQAQQRDLTLVTNNTREFNRVKGLKLADWSV